MPKYVVSSDSEISVREIEGGSPEHPWVPGGRPEFPGFPERPGHGLPPTLPPKDEWPPLPPWFQPGVGLPIPPTPEFPMVPIPPGEGEGGGEEGIWPPIPTPPTLPDLSGKSLALAVIYLSRHVSVVRWVVIDHEEAKEKFEALKGRLPAGGIAGRPPQTKPPVAPPNR